MEKSESSAVFSTAFIQKLFQSWALPMFESNFLCNSALIIRGTQWKKTKLETSNFTEHLRDVKKRLLPPLNESAFGQRVVKEQLQSLTLSNRRMTYTSRWEEQGHQLDLQEKG